MIYICMLKQLFDKLDCLMYCKNKCSFQIGSLFHLLKACNMFLLFYLQGSVDNGTVQDTLTVIEAPRQSDLMIELIKKLKPQVVITGMAHFEAVTSSAFENLLNVTREIGSRLFLDISEHLELSSLPGSNGVLKYLAGRTLPSHAAILCGLVKNQVHTPFTSSFVLKK